ncbi:MAG: methyltransferase domain-containing protein [Myxococcales bacterium]|nr:methyltransferase domain-containing protein [Myxococcales bacterium]
MSIWILWAGCGVMGGSEVQGDPAAREPAAAGSEEHHAHGEADDHATVHHRFDDPEHWSKVFDDPARDAWQKPAELVAALEISAGQTVADIGAGTGYFNPHLAAAVGEGGRVIALDVEPSLVAHMTERARREGTPQVEARLTQPDQSGLEEAEVDHVLLVNTYHHIGQRMAYFRELKSKLREGGQLVVVDYDPEADPEHGPPPEHRLSLAKVTEELEAAGFTFVGELSLLPHQYVGRFR